MTKNERVKDVYLYLKKNRKAMNQSDLSRLLGKQKSLISEILNGTREVTEQFVLNLCRVFPDVNRDWLLYGEGEMINEPQKNEKSSGDSITIPREVFEQLSKLTETILSQQRTIEMMESERKKMLAQMVESATCANVG